MSELSSTQNLEEVCTYLELCVEEAKDKAWGEGISFALCFIKKLLPSAQPEERTNERTETHSCELIDRQAAMGDLLKRSKVERLILAKSLLESVLNDITGEQNAVEMLECLYKRYDTYSSCTIDLNNFNMSWSACLQPQKRWDI